MVLFTRSATALSLGFPLSVMLMPILRSFKTGRVRVTGILYATVGNGGSALTGLSPRKCLRHISKGFQRVSRFQMYLPRYNPRFLSYK